MKGVALLISIIAALLLAETALLIAVFVSPDAANTVGTVAQDIIVVWIGDDESTGLIDRFSEEAGVRFDQWVRPLWGVEPSEQPRHFAECVDCHPDFAERQSEERVRVNHPLHGSLGIDCADCHTDTAHPRPLLPAEMTCETCHEDVNQGGDCHLCHSPGDLDHYYELGAPRTGFVECNACHLPDSLQSSEPHHRVTGFVFNGTDITECSECHSQATCRGCHSVSHPSDWMANHGSAVGYTGSGECTQCHTTTYCAGSCHAVTNLKPFRLRPLPTGGDS